MPLFGRKHIGILSPPDGLSPDEEVFVIEETKEAFRTYQDYLRRLDLYKLPGWTCKLTNRTNLTYFNALKSEETARKNQSFIRKCFKEPILSIAHHSTDRFDDLIDDAHEHVQTIFAEGELVETKRNEKEDVEEATIVKVIPPEEENPDDPEPEPFFYNVQFKKDDVVKAGVNSDEISRLQKAPSKEAIKFLIRDSCVRVGKPDSMLWIVHSHLTKEYDIPDKVTDSHFTQLQAWPSIGAKKSPLPKDATKVKKEGRERSTSHVAKSLKRILGSIRTETKVEKKNGPMKQATLHQFGVTSPKGRTSLAGGQDMESEVDGTRVMNPLPKWKPKSVLDQLCSPTSNSNSKFYRNLLKSAALTLTPTQVEKLPSPERRKVVRKKWQLMTEEEKQKVKEERKEKAKKEREVKKAMSRTVPDEEIVSLADPLPEGVPVILPEGLDGPDFADLVLVTEFLRHFQDLLCPDESQLRTVTSESLATALTSGSEGFGLVASVLVSLLQLLLLEVPTRHRLFSLPVRACPLSIYTVSDLLRIYFEPFHSSQEKLVASPLGSDDNDDSSDGDDNQEKPKKDVASDQEEEEDEKQDEDNVVTPELLKLVDSLDRMEFCELNAREKLLIMVALCHKTLCSDAVDDFLEDKRKKLQELLKDDRTEKAEERAQLKKERERQKEEKLAKNNEHQPKTGLPPDGKPDEKPDEMKHENQSVISFPPVESNGKPKAEEEANMAEENGSKRRRTTVAEAQIRREQQEREKRERRELESREGKELRKQQLEKRKAELKKESRKGEVIQCQNALRLRPFGCDRFFRRYWLFASAMPGVYVEDGWMGEGQIVAVAGEDKHSEWIHYNSPDVLEQLIAALSSRGERESALKGELSKNLENMQEIFRSYVNRSSTRRDKDPLQALKDSLVTLVTKLGRKLLITEEDKGKVERRIDWAKCLEDLIPLVIESQEAVGEVCLKGTLLPDDSKQSSSSKKKEKEKENLLEYWRDAVRGARTLSKLHLLLGVLDASTRWEKGVKIVHQPRRRISLRRAAQAKSYKMEEEEEEDEEENNDGEEEAEDDSDEADTSRSRTESKYDSTDSDIISADDDMPRRRMTRTATRAATKASRKASGKQRLEGRRVLRSGRRVAPSRNSRAIESDDDSDVSSDRRPAKRAKRDDSFGGGRSRRKRPFLDRDDEEQLMGGRSLRRSRRCGGELSAELKICDEIVGDVLIRPESWPFRSPVTKKESPDYHDIIANPMDFGTIKEKLFMIQYGTIKGFLGDVRLVFFNCDAYNREDSEVGVAGRELERYFVRFLRKKIPGASYMPVFDLGDSKESGKSRNKRRLKSH
eukprot:m.60992 g.60992  ORF g.60992 m.60992 type:complete len:1325 (+) comp34963_c0_seq2:1074-5048(+)